MPYLHDVPHFLGILIHSGNTEEIPPAVSSWERIRSREKFWNPVLHSKNCMHARVRKGHNHSDYINRMAVNRLKPPRNLRIEFKPSPRQYELWKLLQPNYCPHCGGEIEQILIGYDQQGNLSTGPNAGIASRRTRRS